MKTLITHIAILFLTLSINCFPQTKNTHKVPVLNIGVFHMGNTGDAHTTDYDEKSSKATKQIKEVVNAIALFKPTIILVEEVPKLQSKLERNYNAYLKDSKADIGYYGKTEIGLLSFAIGKLANTQQIYAIDHKLSYNYNIKEKIKDTENKQQFIALQQQFFNSFFKLANQKEVNLKEHLLAYNSKEGYDILISANADLLTYAKTENNFEGADEAAKYYQRNLRMFSNINNIKTTKDDRILIISGGSHAAFFNMFMQRSKTYKIVPVTKYLHL